MSKHAIDPNGDPNDALDQTEEEQNAEVDPGGSHGDPEGSEEGAAGFDVPPDGVAAGRDEPDDFADGPDESDEGPEWPESEPFMTLEDLGICIASDLLSQGRFKGETFEERCSVVDAADPEDPVVHRAFLAAAVAIHRTLDCDALREEEARVPRLGRAMEAVRRDRGLIRECDLSIAGQIEPTLPVHYDESDLTDIQGMCCRIQHIRWKTNMARYEEYDKGNAYEETLESYWDALQAIALLYGDEGLREILAMEWVHRAIRECHHKLRWRIDMRYGQAK